MCGSSSFCPAPPITTVVQKQRLPVAVFSTPAAEAVIARAGLSLVDLLRPVALVNNLNGEACGSATAVCYDRLNALPRAAVPDTPGLLLCLRLCCAVLCYAVQCRCVLASTPCGSRRCSWRSTQGPPCSSQHQRYACTAAAAAAVMRRICGLSLAGSLDSTAVTAPCTTTPAQCRPQHLPVFVYACACFQAIDERLQGVLELESQRHAQLTPSGNIIQHVQQGESSSLQPCAAEGVVLVQLMQQLGLGTCWRLLRAGMSCPGVLGDRADLAGRAISA